MRATLDRLRTERNVSLAALSRMIRRNEAYLQQFVSRGTPARLAEDDRRMLAIFFNIDERELGARDPWVPAQTQKSRARG
ncbi:hypothetical protein [Sphingomonas sp. NFR15]|uniref:hypothetical protein n=1 Tax=Sphingomonas sp. NFR15 TaxID=1566282 RepID=UPI000886EA1C|nr:hypothetical protein [Sphingomonas sp. NFR15]SDA14813.1 hypothetical protein SAMN03159340_00598 [Sphingomonas sp. NFR15]